MTALKCLTAAAAALVLSVSATAACDDYSEEMAMAEAVKASQVAQSVATESAPTEQAATFTPVPAQPTSLAAVEAKPATETTSGIKQQ